MRGARRRHPRGWDAAAIESLRAEVPDDGWIEGFFRVLIKRRSRKKPISRATINEALRNIDPSDLGLRGNGREKGGIVKLSTQRSVNTPGSLLDPGAAMEQIEIGRASCREGVCQYV